MQAKDNDAVKNTTTYSFTLNTKLHTDQSTRLCSPNY